MPSFYSSLPALVTALSPTGWAAFGTCLLGWSLGKHHCWSLLATHSFYYPPGINTKVLLKIPLAGRASVFLQFSTFLHFFPQFLSAVTDGSHFWGSAADCCIRFGLLGFAPICSFILWNSTLFQICISVLKWALVPIHVPTEQP